MASIGGVRTIWGFPPSLTRIIVRSWPARWSWENYWEYEILPFFIKCKWTVKAQTSKAVGRTQCKMHLKCLAECPTVSTECTYYYLLHDYQSLLFKTRKPFGKLLLWSVNSFKGRSLIYFPMFEWESGTLWVLSEWLSNVGEEEWKLAHEFQVVKQVKLRLCRKNGVKRERRQIIFLLSHFNTHLRSPGHPRSTGCRRHITCIRDQWEYSWVLLPGRSGLGMLTASPHLWDSFLSC